MPIDVEVLVIDERNIWTRSTASDRKRQAEHKLYVIGFLKQKRAASTVNIPQDADLVECEDAVSTIA